MKVLINLTFCHSQKKVGKKANPKPTKKID